LALSAPLFFWERIGIILRGKDWWVTCRGK
jgi:hypothetical protein